MQSLAAMTVTDGTKAIVQHVKLAETLKAKDGIIHELESYFGSLRLGSNSGSDMFTFVVLLAEVSARRQPMSASAIARSHKMAFWTFVLMSASSS